jgi:hypothetical protein
MPGFVFQPFKELTIMFAKQAQIAVAAITLAVAGGAFAKDIERNLFDSEAALQLPAAESKGGLTRAEVRAEFLAARAKGEVDPFNTEAIAYVTPAKAARTQVAQAAK